jgi:hypothetical protein
MEIEEETDEQKFARDKRMRQYVLEMERGSAFGDKMDKMDINQLKEDIPANFGVNDRVGWGGDTPFSYCACLG